MNSEIFGIVTLFITECKKKNMLRHWDRKRNCGKGNSDSVIELSSLKNKQKIFTIIWRNGYIASICTYFLSHPNTIDFLSNDQSYQFIEEGQTYTLQ